MLIRARQVAWVQSLAVTRAHATKILAKVAMAAFGASTVACSGGAGDASQASADHATAASATTPQAASAAAAATAPQKSFEPAWANVAVGSTCTVAPEGETDPAGAVTVPVDEDGIAHFSAVRPTSDEDVQRLTLACSGPAGAKSYSVDLRAGGVFIPPPAQASQTAQTGATALSVRPPMQGDPMALPASELIAQGFGVRPDPEGNPTGYARWLAATQRSLRKHLPAAAQVLRVGTTVQASRPSSDRGHIATLAPTLLPALAPTAATAATAAELLPTLMPGASPTPDAGALAAPVPNSVYCNGMPPSCYWTGAVLSGSYAPSQQQGYALNEATFNVPALVPGGFDSGPTILSIWTGLDNVWQAIVFVQASPTVASTWIETQPHLTVAADSSPNAGANPTFMPNLNDTIYAQEWYCDAQGNVDLNGGYACSFIEDMQTGDGWSCVAADAPKGECASYKLGPSDTVGTQAEFIVENDSPQASVSSDLWPDFSRVAMSGSAEVVKNGTTFVGWSSPSTDTNVTVAEDWPPTNLSYLAQEIVSVQQDGSLSWQIAQPQPAIAAHASGETDVVYQDTDHSLVYMAAPAGAAWTTTTIAPAGTTFSAPAVFVRTDGSDEVDIVVEGANHSLDLYSDKPGQAWTSSTIAPAGVVYSAPSIYVQSSGELDIAFEGTDNTLQYAFLQPGGTWQTAQIAGEGTAFSAPSMQVRDWSNQEVDVAVQGPAFSLGYYSGTPAKGWTTSQVQGANTAYSAPSLAVRRDGTNRIDIAAQGADQTLHDFFNAPNGLWDDALVAGNNTTVGAPSLFVDANGNATIAAEGVRNGLVFYASADGAPWTKTQVSGDLTTYGAPSMVVRPSGEVDLVAPSAGSLPGYYVLSATTSSWMAASL
jgi:hypothetical protein